jgi:hypothetical protein
MELALSYFSLRVKFIFGYSLGFLPPHFLIAKAGQFLHILSGSTIVTAIAASISTDCSWEAWDLIESKIGKPVSCQEGNVQGGA